CRLKAILNCTKVGTQGIDLLQRIVDRSQRVGVEFGTQRYSTVIGVNRSNTVVNVLTVDRPFNHVTRAVFERMQSWARTDKIGIQIVQINRNRIWNGNLLNRFGCTGGSGVGKGRRVVREFSISRRTSVMERSATV